MLKVLKIALFALLSFSSIAQAETKIVQWDGSCVNNDEGGSNSFNANVKNNECAIWVQYVPQKSRIARADVSYELFYNDVQNGRTIEKKKSAHGTDWIIAGGYSPNGLTMAHSVYEEMGAVVLNIPHLFINTRSPIKYSALGIKTSLLFTDGTTKKIYEKFPITY